MKNLKKIFFISMTLFFSSLMAKPVIASADTLYWPVPGHTRISQGFHGGNAIDISDGNIAGSKVVAAKSGVVTHVFNCGQQHLGSDHTCHGFGTGVVIKGDDDRIYQYAHMKSGSIPSSVYEGAYVEAGKKIGQVGTTGNSSGNHLHFGISRGRYWYESGINPKNESYIYGDEEGGFSSDPTVSDIKEDDVTISVNIPLQYVKECGVKIGTSSDNLQIKVREYPNTNVKKIYYQTLATDPASWTGKLKSGTKYYYRIYYKTDSKTYETKTFNFTTKKPVNKNSNGFNNIFITNVTSNDAAVEARIPLQRVRECGLKLGTSSNNLELKAQEFPNSNVNRIYYNTLVTDPASWTGRLQSGTTYYFQFYYITSDGTKYTSGVRSFKTNS